MIWRVLMCFETISLGVFFTTSDVCGFVTSVVLFVNCEYGSSVLPALSCALLLLILLPAGAIVLA